VTLRSWVYLSFITYLPMFLQEQGLPLTTGSLMLTVFLTGGLQRVCTEGTSPTGWGGAG